MAPEDADKRLRAWIAQILLPPDLCPSDPMGIEAMLDAAGGEALPEDQIERMLKKASGELPVGERHIDEEEPIWTDESLTEQERELVALHRNGGTELSPEIQEKLRQLRQQAKVKPKEKEVADDELEP